MNFFDAIVVGGGHAGIEAAAAASRLGCKTLMLTMSVDQIGAMSCNPAIGGLGKSQLAREVDALGGLMCKIADQSAMQYRLLNESKGPAVRATRVQVDRHDYRAQIRFALENIPQLSIKQGQVTELLIENDQIAGIKTGLGQIFRSPTVVITTGTFMNGKAHIGKVNFASGRAGEPPSIGLSDFLARSGVKIGRLKTGTVPRVDARSIDYSVMEEQTSQTDCGTLSYFSKNMRGDLRSAFLGFTNERTHEIIRGSLSESPLYSGIISSRGPRYCPSVEDKIVRFADKDRHQVFLENEGRLTHEVYVGGLSTSLPYECQIEFLRSIRGLEKVEIIRPGYAIEYDYIDATQLALNLEFKGIGGLFFAGQVNGTSGYEEAAAQGIYAGINAGLKAQERDPFLLKRSESYIGVMVDDLTTKGTEEPYRMFTSRAEWRLHLRQDNADIRLCPLARELGLLSDEDFQVFESRQANKERLRKHLTEWKWTPTADTNEKLIALGEAPLKTLARASDLLKRPGFQLAKLKELARDPDLFAHEDADDLSWVETEIKYEGYLLQAKQQISQVAKLEDLRIPADFIYADLPGLTREAKEKLTKILPLTLGQASRISGITPATISVLMLHLQQDRKRKKLRSSIRRDDLLSQELLAETKNNAVK